jgi:parallel beta-helix repeat protein
VFAHNHFGAYTHEAQGMRWSGNTFSDNEEYGFDPHDFSDDFVVENNTAHHNGKHGFIFSRGCLRNVLRGNTAYANTGHGFMIDDGRSTASATAEARIDPSNDNLVTGNVAHDNAGSGVEIEGGTGNVVADNHLSRNHIEVRVKDGATASVTGNQIDGSEAFATITNQQPSMARTPGRAGTSVNSTSTQTARGASASWRLCPTGTKRSASPWAM